MRRKYLLSCLLLLFLFGASFIAYGSMNDDQPVNPDESLLFDTQYVESSEGALIKLKNPKNLDSMVDLADLIITGEVVSTIDLSNTFEMEEGSPERAISELSGGSSSYTVNGADVTIAVSESIKGQPDGKEVVLYLNDNFKNIHPQLNVGDNFIFFLFKNESMGKYQYAHPTAGFMKINKKENKVKPLYLMASDYLDLEDQSYEKVKKKIKDKMK